jgi:hypothetical protein
MNPSMTPEAQAKRRARAALHEDMHARRGGDQLAERARLIAFWRKCSEVNRQYLPHNGCWWHVFTWNPCFRHLCMPRLRGLLEARDREHERRYREELREYGRRWEQKKAERVAAKKAPRRPAPPRPASPQVELFAEAAC